MYYRQPSIAFKLQQFPKPLLSLVAILCALSVITLYSASGGDFTTWAAKQLVSALLAASIIIFLGVLDIKHIYAYSYAFYLLTIMLLILADVSGHAAMGAQRWLKLGPISLQPSEFAKPALILALSRYYHDLHTKTIRSARGQIIPLLLVVLPVFLVLRQPSLGTAIILVMIAGMVMWLAGVMVWQFALAGGGVLLSFPFIWHFYMHGYQKQRILTFLDSSKDPLGSSYNIIQSKIAIGSGGLWGKGWLEGSQTQLSFLPEKQTDFIFTVIAEEHGLIGSMLVLSIYIAIITWGIAQLRESRQQFSQLLTAGIIFMIGLHAFINIAMISGVIPVVGSPLPFLSYGRSNLLAMAVGIGLWTNSFVYQRTSDSKSKTIL